MLPDKSNKWSPHWGTCWRLPRALKLFHAEAWYGLQCLNFHQRACNLLRKDPWPHSAATEIVLESIWQPASVAAFRHCQEPAAAAAAQTAAPSSSQAWGQFSRNTNLRQSISSWFAAAQGVLSSQGQSLDRNHFSTFSWPPAAAAQHTVAFQGAPCSRTCLSRARLPSWARRAHRLLARVPLPSEQRRSCWAAISYQRLHTRFMKNGVSITAGLRIVHSNSLGSISMVAIPVWFVRRVSPVAAFLKQRLMLSPRGHRSHSGRPRTFWRILDLFWEIPYLKYPRIWTFSQNSPYSTRMVVVPRKKIKKHNNPKKKKKKKYWPCFSAPMYSPMKQHQTAEESTRVESSGIFQRRNHLCSHSDRNVFR